MNVNISKPDKKVVLKIFHDCIKFLMISEIQLMNDLMIYITRYNNKQKKIIIINQMIDQQQSQNILQPNLNKIKHLYHLEQQQKIQIDQQQCILVSYLGVRIQELGKLTLTDFRIIFTVQKVVTEIKFIGLINSNNSHQQQLNQNNSQSNIKFDFPIGYISKCESSSQVVNKVPIQYIELITRFGFVFKIKSLKNNLQKVSAYINSIISWVNTQPNSTFGQKRAMRLQPSDRCKKWNESYFKDCQTLKQSTNYDNSDKKYLPAYPEIFKVPSVFIGKRNKNLRIVLLSYVYDNKKNIGLWKTGPGNIDPEQQKWVPGCIKKKDHNVIQIKNKTNGAIKSYAQKIIQMDNPTQLKQCFMKFFMACCYQNETQQQQQKWLVHVNISRWFQQIEIIISQTFLLLHQLSQDINITILSQWDVRSSQICALLQVLAKPQNRMIIGFCQLIERQFLHFGYISQTIKKQREDKGIALIQFLDCVFQIKKMYPLSFQFNQDMLTFIVIHIYSRKYGNFLYFTKVISEQNQNKYLNYQCIWKQIIKFKQYFIDPFFVDPKSCDSQQLKKNIGMKNYRLWGSLFLRDLFRYGNYNQFDMEINKVSQNHRKVWKKHQIIKNQAEDLRIKISNQHKLIAEKKKKLKQLQNLQFN